MDPAVAELGYVPKPNTLARSPRLRQTHTLALVLTDITNPFWTTVARGVEDAASDAGVNVIPRTNSPNRGNINPPYWG